MHIYHILLKECCKSTEQRVIWKGALQKTGLEQLNPEVPFLPE